MPFEFLVSLQNPVYMALAAGTALASLSIPILSYVKKRIKEVDKKAYLLVRRVDGSYIVTAVDPKMDEETGQLYAVYNGNRIFLGQATGMMAGKPLYTYDEASGMYIPIGRIELPEEELRYAAWLKTNILMTEIIGKQIRSYKMMFYIASTIALTAVIASLVLGIALFTALMG